MPWSFHEKQNHEKFQGHKPMAINLKLQTGADLKQSLGIHFFYYGSYSVIIVKKIRTDSQIPQSLHINKF